MRMRVGVVLSLVLATQVAGAKPLPASMQVSLKKGKPYLTTDKVTVQLADNFTDWSEVQAELGDDGSLQLWGARCGMSLDKEETPTQISAGALAAKVENAKGMALHVKKKYADAAKLFAQAVAHDPSTPVYATNLLSALTMGKDVAGANKLLEDGMGKDQLAWYAWRLNVDPELKKLKDQPGAKKFRVDKPSKLTNKLLGDGVAESPLGIAAVRSMKTNPDESFVSFVQLATGVETLRLPVKTAAQVKAVDGVLASMGFELTQKKTAWFGEAEEIAGKLAQTLDIKAAAVTGKYVVYLERSGGCDVSEVDYHAGAADIARTK